MGKPPGLASAMVEAVARRKSRISGSDCTADVALASWVRLNIGGTPQVTTQHRVPPKTDTPVCIDPLIVSGSKGVPLEKRVLRCQGVR